MTRKVLNSSRIGWGLGALAVALALLVGSQVSRSDKPAEKSTRDVPYLDGQWIRYSPGFAERSGLVFAAAESGELAPIVHVTGTVVFDPDRVAAIGARIAGRVRKVYKLAGDLVQRDEVLAEIESAELGGAQATLISARAQAAVARANEKRERELAEAKISSNREAELASAAAAAANAELAAAESRVHAMGGEVSSEPGILKLRSPLPGKVVSRNLSRGQFVEPTLTAFKVADLSRVFVELALFERDVASVQRGDAVDLLPNAGSGAAVSGSVDYVGDEIDLETKTAAVRVIVEQPAARLRPGQSVQASIHTRAPTARAVLLPRDAITSVDGKPTVFVAHDQTSVEPRAIRVGRQDEARIEVVEGLRAGERVATRGVFALKSEIFR